RALFAPSVDRRHRTPISGFLDRWARAARGRSRPSHRQCRWPSLPTIHPVRHNSSWLLLLMVVAAHTDHVLPFARSSHPTDSAEPQSPHLVRLALAVGIGDIPVEAVGDPAFEADGADQVLRID